MKDVFRIITLMGLATLMLGCTPKYLVHINGFLDTAGSQAIAPGVCLFIVEEDENENPIFHREVKQKISKLLVSKGFTLCPPESADYQLLFGYGVDSGRTIEGTRMIHEPSQIVTIRRSDDRGRHSYSTIHVPGLTYTVPYSHTVFGHWLKLYLYDVPDTDETSSPPQPLWIGEVTCSDASSDLREIINPMLAVAFDHFGENTRKRIQATIAHQDPRVQDLQRH